MGSPNFVEGSIGADFEYVNADFRCPLLNRFEIQGIRTNQSQISLEIARILSYETPSRTTNHHYDVAYAVR
jgi:hypothetical protein